jgi:hypothetical protein
MLIDPPVTVAWIQMFKPLSGFLPMNVVTTISDELGAPTVGIRLGRELSLSSVSGRSLLYCSVVPSIQLSNDLTLLCPVTDIIDRS